MNQMKTVVHFHVVLKGKVEAKGRHDGQHFNYFRLRRRIFCVILNKPLVAPAIGIENLQVKLGVVTPQ